MSTETFDATKLTEAQLSACVEELRSRGNAVAVYDAAAFEDRMDGMETSITSEQVAERFDRDSVEEAMHEVVYGMAREVADEFSTEDEDEDLYQLACDLHEETTR